MVPTTLIKLPKNWVVVHAGDNLSMKKTLMKYLGFEFFLTVISVLLAEFLLGVYQMILIYAKNYEKSATHVILSNVI